MRSGTLPTPLCVGLGEACAIAGREMGDEAERVAALRDRFYKGITGRLARVRLNGDAERRIPGNLNLSFAGVDNEGLMAGIKDLAVSSGSACTSASVEPSYVLRAIGLDDGLARGAIRIGFGRFTTEDDVDYAVDRIAGEVERLRRTGPFRETA